MIALVGLGERRGGRRRGGRGAAAPKHPLQVWQALATLAVLCLARLDRRNHLFELAKTDLAVSARISLGKELPHVGRGEVFVTAVTQQRR